MPAWIEEIKKKLDIGVHRSPTGHRIISGNTLPVQDATKLIQAVEAAEKALEDVRLMTHDYIAYGTDYTAEKIYEATDDALAQIQSGEFRKEE